MPKKKQGGGGDALARSIARMSSPREQAGYNRKITRAANIAGRGGSSVGRITASERKAIRLAGRAVAGITTPAEAAGAKAKLRKKARKS